MNLIKNITLFLVLSAVQLQAQSSLPMPRNIQSAYEKGTRSHTGQPGKKYWQNFAAYDLNIHFTPANRLVSGTVNIVYQNNSPDTLPKIHFKLYPNIFKKGAARMNTFLPKDVGAGIFIEKIKVNGVAQDAGSTHILGTEMDVPIQPLLPAGQIQFSIDFSYVLNQGPNQRTGEIEEGAYFIAYFFPRIAVYDDVDGWNTNPYLGSAEFYNDFCDFKANITVPNSYVVWATGDLMNCGEVLNPAFCQRIAEAENKDGLINVIDSVDLKKGKITADQPTNTFRFEAKDVTDFVFATSNHYLWQSTSLVVDKTTGRRTRVDAVFNPKHRDYFRVVGDARATVEAMSFRFPKWPFPYPHETVFDGLDQMEYPMMVNDNPVEDLMESISLTDHEIFHTMFPFYMGINETKYGWMDEGWATIGEWLITPMIDASVVDDYGVDRYEKSAGTEADLPISTLTTQLTGMPLFTNSYPKPAMGYLFVKDMLGDELFYKALHHYIETWHGKHPLPLDFFNCMNEGAGKNMNWFWKVWFYDDGVPNLAISEVSKKQITIESKGSKPVPIDLTIQYADGSNEEIHRSIAVWEKGNRTVNISFVPKKDVVKITLGSTYVPDVDKKDNLYIKG